MAITASQTRTDSHRIKCAKCHLYHSSIQDVKACCGQQVTTPAVPATPKHRSWLDAYREHVADKDAEAAHEAAQERAAYTAKMNRDDALLNRPISPTPNIGQQLRAVENTVPAGRYAIGEQGATKFYRVDKPTEGRWAGYVFVKVQASDEHHPVKNQAARLAILTAIAQDVRGALVRYGMEIGECGVCGRTLTDADSRAYGIGPICRGKLAGLGY